jgi:uncharacterized glyoxalase superfamily protein PhnB
MAYTLTNIYTAEPLCSGTVSVAPLGTDMPTDPLTELSEVSELWTDLGFTGADGFVEKNDRKTDLKRAFGGNAVKTLQSEYSATLEFTFLESLNANVLSAVFGPTNVVITAATSNHGTQVAVYKNSRKLPHQAWVITTYDDELNAVYRNAVANGQVIMVAEIKVVHTDVIEYKVTLECFESSICAADNIITYTDNGLWTGS